MSDLPQLIELVVEAQGPDGQVFGNTLVIREDDLEFLPEFVRALSSHIQMKVGVYGTWCGSMRYFHYAHL